MKNSQTQAPFDTNHALRGGDVPPTTSQHCKRKKHIQGGASAHVHLEESWMSIKELLKLCKKQSHIYIYIYTERESKPLRAGSDSELHSEQHLP